MGYIAKIKCEKCKLDETYRLGQGRKELGVERVVGYCDSCQKYDMYEISYEFKEGGEIIESMNSCSCGNKPVIVLNYSIHNKCQGKIPCRKCGGEITVTTIGDYD